jgi:glucose/arabinose dehydrogenase
MVVLDNGPSGELGRTGHDEVNVLPPDAGGANLGWPTIYGCEDAPATDLRPPELTWTAAVPPSGGSIYRGGAIPAFRGNLLFTTLRSEHLHRVVFDASHRVTSHEVYLSGRPPTGYGRLRGGETGPDGWFYVLTGNCDVIGTCGAPDRVLRVGAR